MSHNHRLRFKLRKSALSSPFKGNLESLYYRRFFKDPHYYCHFKIYILDYLVLSRYFKAMQVGKIYLIVGLSRRWKFGKPTLSSVFHGDASSKNLLYRQSFKAMKVWKIYINVGLSRRCKFGKKYIIVGLSRRC